jgi:hypothetical protein
MYCIVLRRHLPPETKSHPLETRRYHANQASGGSIQRRNDGSYASHFPDLGISAATAAFASQQPQRPPWAPASGGVELAEVDEVTLFEMFPEDADAVEEALRRFAGMDHQAGRALEALLARPSTGTAKVALDAEDNLDYDRAPSVEASEDDDEGRFWEEVENEGETFDEVDDTGNNEGFCAHCGSETVEDYTAEDGFVYCSWCWAEWSAEAASSSPGDEGNDNLRLGKLSETTSAEATSADHLVAVAAARPPPPPVPSASSASASSTQPSLATATSSGAGKWRGGRRSERVAFF